MADSDRDLIVILNQLNQVQQAVSELGRTQAVIAQKDEEDKKTLATLIDVTNKQNTVLAEIFQNQKQFQSQTLKYTAYFVVILLLIIGALLLALNVKGGDTIVGTLLKIVGV